ncbi:hypothetical protein EV191_112175 [Tamaricihabitans halophyticus]|uniref:Uncharacterized protein n=1 Tax=Tamaricihabitans halophyticus TaxID=1262583 RepID=A0A4R2QFC0_9PSEU|nr:hypothetical protein [Tamaricihabitans halophyticus]TCP47379.1 hypothetical protein EV191_112175 [Tamaricihabitans halophyticus]
MSGWDQVQRRHQLIYRVAEQVANDGTAALAGWRPAIVAEYGELSTFLCDAQRRYDEAVRARLDLLLELDQPRTTEALAKIRAEVDRAYPNLTRMLHTLANHSALPTGTSTLAASGIGRDSPGSRICSRPTSVRPAFARPAAGDG